MSAKLKARWRGTREIQEVPDSPDWDFAGKESTCVRVFEGPYETLLAKRAEVGQLVSGMPDGYQVDRVKVKRQRSGKGIMTVTLTAKDASGSVDNEAVVPQHEVEWSEVQKAIEQHPRYASGGTNALTDGDRADIAAWDDEKDAALRKEWKYKDSAQVTQTLSANAQHLAKKKLIAETSYTVWIPVCRRTYSMRLNAGSTGAGFMQTPPSGFGTLPTKSGVAYKWFKTADRSVRSGTHGKWQRVEEWTGFDRVDTDFYS